jgi:hypothetical protein
MKAARAATVRLFAPAAGGTRHDATTAARGQVRRAVVSTNCGTTPVAAAGGDGRTSGDVPDFAEAAAGTDAGTEHRARTTRAVAHAPRQNGMSAPS